MKKYGFTLAEVLITLAIIGVIATLTLPALMTNVRERQYITGLKKVVNTLSFAGEMSENQYGYNFSDVSAKYTTDETFDDEGYLNPNLISLLQATTQVAEVSRTDLFMGSDVYLSFRDGTAILVADYSSFASAISSNAIPIAIDTNGRKGPNTFSNCDGNKALKKGFNVTTLVKALNLSLGKATIDSNDPKCLDKSKRVISDRFIFYLYENHVAPLDSVSAWAMQQ